MFVIMQLPDRNTDINGTSAMLPTVLQSFAAIVRDRGDRRPGTVPSGDAARGVGSAWLYT